MKKKLVITLLASLVLISLAAIPITATDFTMPSHAELDTSFQGKIPPKFDITKITTEEEAEKYPFTWWRDTTNQNNLWNYTVAQSANTIIPVYAVGTERVLVFSTQAGTNVVAIVGPQGNTIIGCGGSRNAARIALGAFAKAVPDFQKNLRAIIFTDSIPETVWGASEFVGGRTDVLIYGRDNFQEVYSQWQAVSSAIVQRNLYAYGPQLQYGPNGNLGTGSSFGFQPYQVNNGMLDPNRIITSKTGVTLGGVTMELIPSAEADAGLLVYLPSQGVLIVGEIFGKYFPPIGALTENHIPATQWISTLDKMITLNPNYLASLHAQPIINQTNVLKALTDQKNALTSVHDQTVQQINAMKSLDDIVATVQLPESLRSSPWVQEYTGTVANAVRAIYHQYLGWFDGEVDSLSTLDQVEQAWFIIQLAGGPDKALAAAKTYNQDHTMAGIKKAIILCKALHLVSPSVDTDKVYIQALRKMGYSQTSGQMRNYYLLMAQRLEHAL